MCASLSAYMVNGQEGYFRLHATDTLGTPVVFHYCTFKILPTLFTSWLVPRMPPVTLHPTGIALLTELAARFGGAFATSVAKRGVLTLSVEHPVRIPLFGAARFTRGLRWDDRNLTVYT